MFSAFHKLLLRGLIPRIQLKDKDRAYKYFSYNLLIFQSISSLKTSCMMNSATSVNHPSHKEKIHDKFLIFGRRYLYCKKRGLTQGVEKPGTNEFSSYVIIRSFASEASKRMEKAPSETRKDVSTAESPFDLPTYNIPEKPVTFTEGASYSIVILAGLGVAAVAAFAVFKELIFQPKEYKIFNKALDRIKKDSQVISRIGSPITGYGQESRNRAARQRIPMKTFTDDDGAEHIQISFYVRGPHGGGRVAAEMFKDKADKQWKYTYLIVQFTQPYQSQLILESYMPAPAL